MAVFLRDKDITSNFKIMKEVIERGGGEFFRYASEELRGNAELAMKAISTYPKSFIFASKEVRMNPNVAKMAVSLDNYLI